ncbi:MAG: ATP synthase F1 subunit delta [Pyrinomonadaceae bacterium]
MSMQSLARRYGVALADVAITRSEEQTVLAELNEWVKMIDESALLAETFKNPTLALADKESALNQLIERSMTSQITANFLRVLLRNQRLPEIKQITERYRLELDSRTNRVSAEISTARPIGEAEKEVLISRLSQLTGKEVRLEHKIDESLIGGIVTRIGSTIYDASVKSQLQQAKDFLLSARVNQIVNL